MRKTVLALLAFWFVPLLAMEAGENTGEVGGAESCLAKVPKEMLAVILTRFDTMGEAIKSIKSLSHTNQELRALINDEQMVEFLINELYEQFSSSKDWSLRSFDKIAIAALLATPGAIEWLDNLITTDERAKKEAEELLLYMFTPTLSMLERISDYPFILTVFRSLVQTNIDVNVRDGWGNTALLLAVRHRKAEIVAALLTNPTTDTTISDREGETALTLAEFFDDVAIASLLRAYLSGVA